MIYLILIVFILVLSVKFDFTQADTISKEKEKWYFITFVLIAGISAFRYEIGGDSVNYSLEYASFPDLSSLNLKDSGYRYQPLWVLLVSTCKTVTNNFLLLQAIIAVFTNAVFFWFIKKQTSNYFISLLVYLCVSYFQFNFEILREVIAISLCLISFDAFEHKKYFRTVAFLVCAFFFHVSAVFFALVFYIPKIRLNFRISLIISLCILIISIFFSGLLLNIFLSFDIFASKVNIEYYDVVGLRNNANINSIIYQYLTIFGFGLLLLLFNNSYNGKLSLSFIFFFCAFLFLSCFSIAFGRFSNYIAPFLWITAADSISCLTIKNGNNKLLITVLSIVLTLYVFQYNLLGNDSVFYGQKKYERYFPYKTVLEKSNTYNSSYNISK